MGSETLFLQGKKEVFTAGRGLRVFYEFGFCMSWGSRFWVKGCILRNRLCSVARFGGMNTPQSSYFQSQ